MKKIILLVLAIVLSGCATAAHSRPRTMTSAAKQADKSAAADPLLTVGEQ